jgi:hypothetical protein
MLMVIRSRGRYASASHMVAVMSQKMDQCRIAVQPDLEHGALRLRGGSRSRSLCRRRGDGGAAAAARGSDRRRASTGSSGFLVIGTGRRPARSRLLGMQPRPAITGWVTPGCVKATVGACGRVTGSAAGRARRQTLTGATLARRPGHAP